MFNFIALAIARIVVVFIPIKHVRKRVRRRVYEGLRNKIGFFYFDLFIKRLFTKKTTYDCVFSLGSGCFTAYALRKAHLRKFSAPYDWVYGCTLEKRISFLINGFKDFFNKEDFELLEIKSKGTKLRRVDGILMVPGRHYRNKRTGLSYPHDFEQDGDFDMKFSLTKSKYEKRIQRLLDKINNGKNILMVYTETHCEGSGAVGGGGGGRN
ncbi:MAG: papain-like cysteine peptidase [Rickettsiales bacterium]|jgi:hypothetical protein|nr:papain-like cysteine peptidase [Rickettsiales bacterium]